MLRRLLTLVLIAGCRTAEFSDDLRLSVLPRTLEDDGDRARVVVAANDKYGEPGTGHVSVRSTAGSLRDGIDIVLDADGIVETELTCDAKADADCHDTVTVTATWQTPDGTVFEKSTAVSVRTTDAFVSACAFSNRRMLKLLVGDPAVVQLAVLDTGPEVARGPRGVAVWDGATGVGALSVELPSRGASASEEERQLLAVLEGVGAVGNPLVQTLTTWDGYPAARTTFDFGAAGDLKSVIERVSQALGLGATGLTGDAGKSGPFKGQLVVARHDLGKSALVLALHEAAGFSEAATFDLEDVAGGSALAFAEDRPVDHCEIFTVEGSKKVDFVWVVDDSCSMATSQTAVARVGAQAAARIQGAQLDFRVAGVSTGWYPPVRFGSYREWTKELPRMLGWFNGSQAWGTGGSGDERGFEAAATFIQMSKSGAVEPFRSDSEIHFIFLTDTRDHSGTLAPADMKRLFADSFPRQRVIVSGIVCPEGQLCGDDPELAMGEYHTLIRETGGVLGSIKVFNPPSVTPALQQQQIDTMNRIVGTVVNGAGYPLKYRPITASIRIAASAVVDARCDNRDIPRSTENGWDMDPASGRIGFYGYCVPLLGGAIVASYKSWARYGTQLVEVKDPRFVVAVPAPDGGAAADAGSSDAGSSDAGSSDAGSSDAGSSDAGSFADAGSMADAGSIADAGDGG